jgi:hypothetical protein
LFTKHGDIIKEVAVNADNYIDKIKAEKDKGEKSTARKVTIMRIS